MQYFWYLLDPIYLGDPVYFVKGGMCQMSIHRHHVPFVVAFYVYCIYTAKCIKTTNTIHFCLPQHTDGTPYCTMLNCVDASTCFLLAIRITGYVFDNFSFHPQ